MVIYINTFSKSLNRAWCSLQQCCIFVLVTLIVGLSGSTTTKNHFFPIMNDLMLLLNSWRWLLPLSQPTILLSSYVETVSVVVIQLHFAHGITGLFQWEQWNITRLDLQMKLMFVSGIHITDPICNLYLFASNFLECGIWLVVSQYSCNKAYLLKCVLKLHCEGDNLQICRYVIFRYVIRHAVLTHNIWCRCL